MNKYLQFETGEEYLLVDISYDEFCETYDWCGMSDTAYEDYKRQFGMVELTDFADYDPETNMVLGTKIIEK